MRCFAETKKTDLTLKDISSKKKMILRLICLVFWVPSLWIDPLLNWRMIKGQLNDLDDKSVFILDHFQLWVLIFPLKRKFPNSEIFIVSHNLEYRNKLSYVKYAPFIFKILALLEVPSIYLWEKICAKKSIGVIAINSEDVEFFKNRFQCKKTALLYPYSNIQADYNLNNANTNSNNLVLVGSYGYKAKELNVLWLIGSIFERISSKLPELKLQIIGRGASEALIEKTKLNSNIEFVGEVPELESWYKNAFAVVIPERIGGGFKLKIIEAINFKKPIIIHSDALRGSGLVDGEDCLAFDDDVTFIKAYKTLSNNKIFYNSIIQSAWNKRNELYVKEKAKKALEELLNKDELR